MSNIHELPREDALSFVANIMNEEEAVGVDLQQPATPAARTSARKPLENGGGGNRGVGRNDGMDVDDDDNQVDLLCIRNLRH